MARDGTHRIRSIHPEFWTHKKTIRVARKNPLAIILLLGIWTPCCDDAGRFDADPAYLRAHVFSGLPAVTDEDVSTMLQLLSSVGFVHLYEDSGEQYGVAHDWLQWQRIDRPCASTRPINTNKYCKSPSCDCYEVAEKKRGRPAKRVNHAALSSTNDRRTIDEQSTNDQREEGRGMEGIGMEGRREGHAPLSPKDSDATGIPDEKWKPVWVILTGIDGWPMLEEETRPKAERVMTLYQRLDIEACTRDMAAWHATKPRERPSLMRWRNWLAKDAMDGKHLLVPPGNGDLAAFPSRFPDPATLTAQQLRDQLVNWERDKLRPAEWQDYESAARGKGKPAGPAHEWSL